MIHPGSGGRGEVPARTIEPWTRGPPGTDAAGHPAWKGNHE